MVSNGITLPVGFTLYEPDPEVKKSKDARKTLKAKGVDKKYLPKVISRSSLFPTKVELALSLLKEFSINHPNIKVTAVVADALYGTKHFVT